MMGGGNDNGWHWVIEIIRMVIVDGCYIWQAILGYMVPVVRYDPWPYINN